MNENIFDKRRLKTFSNCKDLVRSMVGTRDGVIVYNEKFRLDLENTCYKASICEDLQRELEQLKEIEKEHQRINGELRVENKKLKKKYLNAVADYETTMAEKEQLNSLVNSCQEEIRQLKKQLTTYQILYRDCKVENLKNISKIEEMENQHQKINGELREEIKEYQKELEKADSITQSCIFNGKKESEISYRKALNELEKTNKANQELKDRIDKVIEYIEKHTENIDRGKYYEDYVETYYLLKILKGGKE